jgi:glycosyltransferase involved in cell wall biosynthesis
MYNCAPQVTRTLAQLTPAVQAHFEEILLVDNGSTDGGPDAAIEFAKANLPGAPVVVVKNDNNLNLGGSHKVAFQRCLDQGYDGMFVFHGDDQGHLEDLLHAVDRHPDAECVLGARFMRKSRISGYAPHRIAANVVFNGLFSAISKRALWDLGSGLNFYRRSFIERRLWEGCGDDLTFNYHLILRSAAVRDVSMAFVPISWREDDQVSNAKLYKHGVTMLRIVRDFVLSRERFVSTDHSTAPTPRTFTVLHP